MEHIRNRSSWLVVLIMGLTFAGPVAVSGPLEGGISVYNRKDFESSTQSLRPLAEQGNGREIRREKQKALDILPIAALSGFGDSTNVSNNQGNSMLPISRVDGQGNIHIVWMDNTSGNTEILYSHRTKQSRSKPVKISKGRTPSLFPSMDVTTSGTVHVAWMAGWGDEFDIYHSTLADGVWSAPSNVSNMKGVSQRPFLIIDRSEAAHIIWYDNKDKSFALWHSTRKGRAWSSPAKIDLIRWYITRDPNWVLIPAVTVDSIGNIHVVWVDIDLSDNECKFQCLFHSKWNGTSWTKPKRASKKSHRPREAVIVSRSSGSLHLTWTDRDSVWYSERFKNRWSVPVKISEHSFMPTMSTCSSGQIHLSWVDGKARQIFYSRKTINGWTAPVNVSQSTVGSAAPSLTCDKRGAVHLVWMDNTPGNFDIYYRRSLQ